MSALAAEKPFLHRLLHALADVHSGPDWLDLRPTGRLSRARVAGWYHLFAGNRIVDSRVLLDVPHMVRKIGLDIFNHLHLAAASPPDYWPEPPLPECGVLQPGIAT